MQSVLHQQKRHFLNEQDVYVELTFDALDVTSIMIRVKSPEAGAIVLFAGMMMIHYFYVVIV